MRGRAFILHVQSGYLNASIYGEFILRCGPGSSVDIATSYRLDGSGMESRWGARFSASVRTGPGAHAASYTMSTVSSLGVKSGRGVTLTPHNVYYVRRTWNS